VLRGLPVRNGQLQRLAGPRGAQYNNQMTCGQLDSELVTLALKEGHVRGLTTLLQELVKPETAQSLQSAQDGNFQVLDCYRDDIHRPRCTTSAPSLAVLRLGNHMHAHDQSICAKAVCADRLVIRMHIIAQSLSTHLSNIQHSESKTSVRFTTRRIKGALTIERVKYQARRGRRTEYGWTTA
jgi:hypothetical protein